MAKHEIKIHENTSRTKETAQYLGSYITKTTVSLAQLCTPFCPLLRIHY